MQDYNFSKKSDWTMYTEVKKTLKMQVMYLGKLGLSERLGISVEKPNCNKLQLKDCA